MDVLARAASALTRWSERWIPGSFVIVALLTIFTVVLALTIGRTGPAAIVKAWGDGFWELLAFAMQMCLVMVTGYIVAVAPLVRRGLRAVARAPRGPRSAVALMAFLSMGLAWINWGLSIVGSAVLVGYMAREQRRVDYRLLVTAAYLGLGLTWHAGLSASAPLLVATPGHFLEKTIGVIPITQTIFSAFNLTLVVVITLVMTALVPLLHPDPERTVSVDATAMETLPEWTPPARPASPSPAERLEHARWVNGLLAVGGAVWLVLHIRGQGLAAINLNVVNFAFLMLGVLLHGTPASLMSAAEHAARIVWGVIIQFPFYAGIYGIMNGAHLATAIGGAFTRIATPSTYPALIYWYSGLVNYFVPSGGSKWAIEAPYVVEAARALHVPIPHVVLSYAWGDMMTDVIQPFWAIPLLAAARLEFRQIMGYCLVIFAVYAVIVSLAFWFFLR
jgi:short-chain fatty acids transporter